MTVGNLTEQMLEDYRPYIKPEAFDSFRSGVERFEKIFGPVKGRVPVYSEDGDKVIRIMYEYDGCPPRVLDAGQAGVENLEF